MHDVSASENLSGLRVTVCSGMGFAEVKLLI